MSNTKQNLSVRWAYLVIGVIAMLFAGILYAWSILKSPFSSEFGWGASNLALNFTLAMCFFCIGGLLGAQLAKRVGHKVAIIVAGILAALGFILTSSLPGRRACPTQGHGCLSEITQRRGELTAEEEDLMRRCQTAWGCDICQDVCPANQTVEKTKLPAFCEELVYRFCADELSALSNRAIERKYADRAFVWRGGSILRRNAMILRESDADTARS